MPKSYVPQYSFIDLKQPLTEKQLEKLEKSFFGILREEIIPNIDTSRYAILNSESGKGRKPIDAAFKIAALIIKSAYDLSYDELDDMLEFDLRVKYAFEAEYENEKPVSGRTLRRFLLDAQELYIEEGIDLIHETFEEIAELVTLAIEADPRLVRMDSSLIESDIKNLSRQEIILRCLQNAVKALEKEIALPEEFQVYLENDLGNRLFYYKSPDLTKEQIDQQLLEDAWKILKLIPKELQELEEYLLLERALNEQSELDENGTPRFRDKKEIKSDSLQNPADPKATFRHKAGKDHKGFQQTTGQITNGHEGVITVVQVDPNNRSDSDIIKDIIPEISREEPTKLIADGAYGSVENQRLAQTNNIELITTNLPGKPVDPAHGQIKWNDDMTMALECPAGHELKKCTPYNNGSFGLSMDNSMCEGCPKKDNCLLQPNPKAKKPRVRRATTSVTAKQKADIENNLTPEEKEERKKNAHFRNGIEALFSDLKRNYGLSKVGSQRRGLVRTGVECVVAATAWNCKSLLRYRQRVSWSADTSPELA